jgi:hypothetical protein
MYPFILALTATGASTPMLAGQGTPRLLQNDNNSDGINRRKIDTLSAATTMATGSQDGRADWQTRREGRRRLNLKGLGDIANSAGYLAQSLRLGLRWKSLQVPETPHHRKGRS